MHSKWGADAIELPAIEIRPAESFAALDAAIESLDSFDWLLFTSANGVKCFLDRLDRSRRDVRAIRGEVCAIGPATRAALAASHIKVDLMPAEYVAESVLAALANRPVAGRRFLLARAAVARDVLPTELRRRGAVVDVVEAYRTVAPDDLASRARELFAGPARPHWITFTSSSTVENFVRAAGAEVLRGIRVASIGPVTSATARKFGIEVTAEASKFDVEGLLEAILHKGIIGT